MRRQGFAAALLAIVLLALSGGALAQNADPLGLISVGAVLPFWIGGDNVSTLQVASPAGSNVGRTVPFPLPGMHLVFFNSVCKRIGSVRLPLTENGVALVPLNRLLGTGIASGLVVIAGTFNDGDTIVPLQNPIHARLHWVNVREDFARVVDPISVRSPGSTSRWNPLQTAATFFAPLLDPGKIDTTLHLVCPTVNITGDSDTPGLITGAPLVPGATTTSNGVATNVNAVVFNDEEVALGSIHMIPCSCLTSTNLASLSILHSDPRAPNGTYTELVGSPLATPKRFTGYLAIQTTLEGERLDGFARLNNGPAESLRR